MFLALFPKYSSDHYARYSPRTVPGTVPVENMTCRAAHIWCLEHGYIPGTRLRVDEYLGLPALACPANSVAPGGGGGGGGGIIVPAGR